MKCRSIAETSALLHSRLTRIHIAGVCLAMATGCASAVKNAETTSLTGADLVRMTDDMAQQITASAVVQQSIAARGAVKVVVLPVVNELQAEVIPRGPAHAFTGRLRVLLQRAMPDHFIWIMNREAFHDLKQRERETAIDPGLDPQTIDPEFALTATFSSLSDETRQGRQAFYVCVFELTSLADRTLLWSGSYEVQKQTVKGFLD